MADDIKQLLRDLEAQVGEWDVDRGQLALKTAYILAEHLHEAMNQINALIMKVDELERRLA